MTIKPPMQIGICTSVDNARSVKEAGADFIEEHVQNFLVLRESDETFSAKLEAAKPSPLPVVAANCFLPGDLKCIGPSANTDQILRYAEKAFCRAAKMGISIIVFGSAGARNVPEGFPKQTAV